MYYQGTPFVESSEIKENELDNYRSYFTLKRVDLDYLKSFYFEGEERNPNFVIYSEANPEDDRLHEYHKSNFGEISFHVEQTISEKVIKTTAFKNHQIVSIRVFIYDDLWRAKYEQWYDGNFSLVEYRQLYYKGNEVNEVPFEERIFFAKNWTTLTENYGD